MHKQRRAQFGSGCCGAACVLLLLCSIVPTTLRAQSTSSDQAPSAKKKITGTSTSSAKTNAATTKRTTGRSHHATPAHARSTTSASSLSARNASKRVVSKKRSGKKLARGQQKIDPERAEAIQEALIREHYLSGEPAGTWNQQTEDAMRRYQADHGWQSKEVPDSRALISLGLGPSHDHLLNPESAMTTGPEISHSAPPTSAAQPDPVSHGPEPGAPMNTSPTLQGSAPSATSSDHESTGPQ